ncbi:hypothetical protein B0H16DRAFT_1475119 [Mycena metata]|uniref:Uncharacterized protein n=1 Tax=Mycena metata TaxID=1033252 RepID=A0AAD7HF29_9AGAR|nr:hypothetical protein B0H16DRAFT_1475119 [Mycena metata]
MTSIAHSAADSVWPTLDHPGHTTSCSLYPSSLPTLSLLEIEARRCRATPLLPDFGLSAARYLHPLRIPTATSSPVLQSDPQIPARQFKQNKSSQSSLLSCTFFSFRPRRPPISHSIPHVAAAAIFVPHVRRAREKRETTYWRALIAWCGESNPALAPALFDLLLSSSVPHPRYLLSVQSRRMRMRRYEKRFKKYAAKEIVFFYTKPVRDVLNFLRVTYACADTTREYLRKIDKSGYTPTREHSSRMAPGYAHRKNEAQAGKANLRIARISERRIDEAVLGPTEMNLN